MTGRSIKTKKTTIPILLPNKEPPKPEYKSAKIKNHAMKITQSIKWAKIRSPTLAGVNARATFWVVCI